MLQNDVFGFRASVRKLAMIGDQMKFGVYSIPGNESAAQSPADDLSHFSKMHITLGANSLFPCNVRTNGGERSSFPSNRYAATFKQMHKKKRRFCVVAGANVPCRFKLDADTRQAQRDSELTKIKAMRKTNPAIHDAVNDAAKATCKAGEPHLVNFPQSRSQNF